MTSPLATIQGVEPEDSMWVIIFTWWDVGWSWLITIASGNERLGSRYVMCTYLMRVVLTRA